MKYISDIIYIDIDIDEANKNKYAKYTIYAQQGFLYNSSPELKPIYVGRMYCYKDKMRLFLNDIIQSHTYADDYFKAQYEFNPNMTDLNPEGVIQRFILKIEFPDTTSAEYTSEWILSYDKDINLKTGEDIDPLTTNIRSYNVLKQRTNVLPHLPEGVYEDGELFLGALMIVSRGFLDYEESLGLNSYQISGVTNEGRVIKQFTFDNIAKNNIFAINLNASSYLNELLTPEIDMIGFGGALPKTTNGSFSRAYSMSYDRYRESGGAAYQPIAIVDHCPADYYLLWLDRTGAFQSQAFSKRGVMEENITRDSLVDILDIERPYRATIEYEWTLNSDWLNEEQYKAYESLLSSSYTYLYDSKLKQGWWVNCTNSSWTEKTRRNQKKMWNMNVKVKANKNQIMLH